MFIFIVLVWGSFFARFGFFLDLFHSTLLVNIPLWYIKTVFQNRLIIYQNVTRETDEYNNGFITFIRIFSFSADSCRILIILNQGLHLSDPQVNWISHHRALFPEILSCMQLNKQLFHTFKNKVLFIGG